MVSKITLRRHYMTSCLEVSSMTWLLKEGVFRYEAATMGGKAGNGRRRHSGRR